VVLREPLVDGVLGGRAHDVQHVAAVVERAAEQDEALLDECVHEPGMLVPPLLLAHVTRPVPWPTAPAANDPERLSQGADRTSSGGPRDPPRRRSGTRVPAPRARAGSSPPPSAPARSARRDRRPRRSGRRSPTGCRTPAAPRLTPLAPCEGSRSPRATPRRSTPRRAAARRG